MASADCIDKKKLTNTLNYLHFKGDHLYVLLKHPRYEEGILVKAHPEPCLGDELTCHWSQAYSVYKLEHYHLQYLVISDDQSVILVPARMFVTNGNGLTVQLPEQSFVISQRQAPRFPLSRRQSRTVAKRLPGGGGINGFRSPCLSHTRSIRPALFVSLV